MSPNLFAWQRRIRADGTPSPTEKLVALIFAGYVNAKTGAAYPSVETLARDTGRSVRTVQRALRVLEGKSYLVSTPRRGKTTIYTITGGGTGDTPTKGKG